MICCDTYCILDEKIYEQKMSNNSDNKLVGGDRNLTIRDCGIFIFFNLDLCHQDNLETKILHLES